MNPEPYKCKALYHRHPLLSLNSFIRDREGSPSGLKSITEGLMKQWGGRGNPRKGRPEAVGHGKQGLNVVSIAVDLTKRNSALF